MYVIIPFLEGSPLDCVRVVAFYCGHVVSADGFNHSDVVRNLVGVPVIEDHVSALRRKALVGRPACEAVHHSWTVTVHRNDVRVVRNYGNR